jgi:hypothetical protein
MREVEGTHEGDRAARLRRALLELLTARGPSGAPRFSTVDVRRCLTAMYLVASQRLGASGRGLSDDAARGLLQFLDPDAVEAPERAAAGIEAHYREHPIDPALARACEPLLREFVHGEGGEGVEELSPRLARLLGTEAPRRPQLGEARPEVAAPAGPLSPFQLQPIVRDRSSSSSGTPTEVDSDGARS